MKGKILLDPTVHKIVSMRWSGGTKDCKHYFEAETEQPITVDAWTCTKCQRRVTVEKWKD